MDDYISRSEHEEFRRSMDLANKNLEDENRRQNKRLDMLEEISKQNTALVTNVERLAVNMENMLKVQEQQGDRLETLEKRDEVDILTIRHILPITPAQKKPRPCGVGAYDGDREC